MKWKKVVLFLVLFALSSYFVVFSILTIYDQNNERTLRNEIHKLSKKDLSNLKIDERIKSEGKYSIVEKAIKEYLKNYSEHYKELNKIISDDKLTKLLTFDNYQSDGPEFEKSLSYLDTTKKSFDENITFLIDGLKKENIKKFILSYTTDSKLISLYEELMFGKYMKTDLAQVEKDLEISKAEITNLIAVSHDVLTFLKVHKENWKLEDNQVKFINQDLVNEYNSYVVKLRKE